MSEPEIDAVTELAIVGLGSWGLCVLERTINRATETGRAVRVHVVEPGDPGGGVYNLEQPDYLVLNNPCGQLSLYTSTDSHAVPPYGLGLYEWSVAQGYRWIGHECRIGEGGEAIRPTDYLPRRIMGEYLGWFYETLVAHAPANLQVVRHCQYAVDIVSEAAGRERVVLEDGDSISVDHVILTSGHTFNREDPASVQTVQGVRPYPVDHFADEPLPGEAMAISGMGLVAFDLLTALTVGRGGVFEPDGDRVRYHPSGREPVVYLYSRSGLPYCAKSATGIDPTGDYEPVVCTPEAFAAIRERRGPGASRHQADFRSDVLPLLFAEMSARYYYHAVFLAHGVSAADLVRTNLRSAWSAGRYDQELQSLAECYGAFDPEQYFFPPAEVRFATAEQYELHVYKMVEEDLEAALAEGGSPIKAAMEVTRILRDDLRSVIEFGGLSLESYLDFQANVRGRINRVEAGPPPMRTAQMLALMDAGIVRVPFGPSPEVTADGLGAVIRSTALEQERSERVALVVRGHLDLPSLARSASPLLSRLYRLGRLTQLQYGQTAVGSVAISETFHPFDVEGRLQEHISVLGVLTEGVRYFTHYLPSPKSRLRAVLDAQACVQAVIG
jgi:uncharacterized NAD(P)/FAD-binding protein YdhS